MRKHDEYCQTEPSIQNNFTVKSFKYYEGHILGFNGLMLTIMLL